MATKDGGYGCVGVARVDEEHDLGGNDGKYWLARRIFEDSLQIVISIK
jgi:hypothetical protein